MRTWVIWGCTMLMASPSPATAQLIDLEKLWSKETQAEIRRKTGRSADTKAADKAPADVSTASDIDFTSDFARVIEKTKPKDAPVSSRFSDEVGKKRADRFFGSSGAAAKPTQPAPSKDETYADFLAAAQVEYQKVGDFPLALENLVRENWRRFSFVRTLLADLRTTYSGGANKTDCEWDYQAMKNKCVPSLIKDNPAKIELISTAYRRAQKAHEDGLGASLNYGSSTVKQERATPEEIEKRMFPGN